MDKSVYAGTAISPALDWSYKMGDFGTEALRLSSGFPVVPYWVVYYPINIKEAVQQLPTNYVSLESAENLLHQVGDLQGFDFDSISVDDDGAMQINGLVDTKETIINLETDISSAAANEWKLFNEHDNQVLEELYNKQYDTYFLMQNLAFYFNGYFAKPVTIYQYGYPNLSSRPNFSVYARTEKEQKPLMIQYFKNFDGVEGADGWRYIKR